MILRTLVTLVINLVFLELVIYIGSLLLELTLFIAISGRISLKNGELKILVKYSLKTFLNWNLIFCFMAIFMGFGFYLQYLFA